MNNIKKQLQVYFDEMIAVHTEIHEKILNFYEENKQYEYVSNYYVNDIFKELLKCVEYANEISSHMHKALYNAEIEFIYSFPCDENSICQIENN